LADIGSDTCDHVGVKERKGVGGGKEDLLIAV
jgi:hypothetical protein